MAWVVDTCLLIDVLEDDPEFGESTAEALDAHSEQGLVVCPMSYAELAPAFQGDRSLQDEFLAGVGVDFQEGWQWQDTVRAHQAWNDFVRRKRAGQLPKRPLADILIGAFATRFQGLLTRNSADFEPIFPSLELRTPDSDLRPKAAEMTTGTGTDIKVRVTRRFEAAPERVFDAWLDPAMLGRWMFGPGVRDEEIVRLTLDPYVGGSFSFLVRRQGEEIDHVGEYLEIDRPRRLVFTWAIKGGDSSRVIVDIAPLETGSELTLTHELHPDWADYASRTEAAWTKMLDALAGTLE